MEETMTWNETTRAKYRRTGDHRQNNLIEPMIPKQDRMCRTRKTDPSEFLDAIRYMPTSSSRASFRHFSEAQNHFTRVVSLRNPARTRREDRG